MKRSLRMKRLAMTGAFLSVIFLSSTVFAETAVTNVIAMSVKGCSKCNKSSDSKYKLESTTESDTSDGYSAGAG